MLHVAPIDEIHPRTLYALLRLRSEVFVVEQQCAYLDPDGRDLEEDCEQLWIDDETGSVAATARLLREPDGRVRIGRVCTTPGARRSGLAARIVRDALDRCGGATVVIDAQSQLTGWYAQFGFEPTGHTFMEDGIHHTEMIRP